MTWQRCDFIVNSIDNNRVPFPLSEYLHLKCKKEKNNARIAKLTGRGGTFINNTIENSQL